MAYFRSRIAKNTARDFLAQKGMAAQSAAQATGIPEENLCALAVSISTGYAVRFLVPDWSAWQVIAGGALIVVFSVLGDLVASAIKREANVKDFGRALGATGGFLDRFDSLLFAAPVFYVFALLLDGG